MADTKLGPYTYGSLNASNDLPSQGKPAIFSIQLIGTSTQTIEFQESLDGGTTYVARRVTNLNSGAAAASMTAAGLFVVGEPGSEYRITSRQVRLRNTAYTSGSFTAHITITTDD